MKNVRDMAHLLELERRVWMHNIAYKQRKARRIRMCKRCWPNDCGAGCKEW